MKQCSLWGGPTCEGRAGQTAPRSEESSWLHQLCMCAHPLLCTGSACMPLLPAQAAEQPRVCRRGHAVKATRGDAVFFWALKPDGGKDRSSLHGSCPTLKVLQRSCHLAPLAVLPLRYIVNIVNIRHKRTLIWHVAVLQGEKWCASLPHKWMHVDRRRLRACHWLCHVAFRTSVCKPSAWLAQPASL